MRSYRCFIGVCCAIYLYPIGHTYDINSLQMKGNFFRDTCYNLVNEVTGQSKMHDTYIGYINENVIAFRSKSFMYANSYSEKFRIIALQCGNSFLAIEDTLSQFYQSSRSFSANNFRKSRNINVMMETDSFPNTLKYDREYPDGVKIDKASSYYKPLYNYRPNDSSVELAENISTDLYYTYVFNSQLGDAIVLQTYVNVNGTISMFPGVFLNSTFENIIYDPRTDEIFSKTATLSKDVIILIEVPSSFAFLNGDLSIGAAVLFLKTLSNKDRVNIFYYYRSTEKVDVILPVLEYEDLIPATNENILALKLGLFNFIHTDFTGTFPNISKILQFSINKFKNSSDAACLKVILLLAVSCARLFEIKEVTSKINPSKDFHIFTYAVGFLLNSNLNCLKRLASLNGGKFYKLETYDEAVTFVPKYLSDLAARLEPSKYFLMSNQHVWPNIPPLFTGSYPIHILSTKDGINSHSTFVGVATVGLTYNTIANLLPNLPLPPGSYYAIISYDSELLYHPFMKIMLKNLHQEYIPIRKDDLLRYSTISKNRYTNSTYISIIKALSITKLKLDNRLLELYEFDYPDLKLKMFFFIKNSTTLDPYYTTSGNTLNDLRDNAHTLNISNYNISDWPYCNIYHRVNTFEEYKYPSLELLFNYISQQNAENCDPYLIAGILMDFKVIDDISTNWSDNILKNDLESIFVGTFTGLSKEIIRSNSSYEKLTNNVYHWYSYEKATYTRYELLFTVSVTAADTFVSISIPSYRQINIETSSLLSISGVTYSIDKFNKLVENIFEDINTTVYLIDHTGYILYDRHKELSGKLFHFSRLINKTLIEGNVCSSYNITSNIDYCVLQTNLSMITHPHRENLTLQSTEKIACLITEIAYLCDVHNPIYFHDTKTNITFYILPIKRTNLILIVLSQLYVTQKDNLSSKPENIVYSTKTPFIKKGSRICSQSKYELDPNLDEAS